MARIASWKKILKSTFPEADSYFPEDQITDQPERFLASEIIRGKKQSLSPINEVPHALAVIVDKWEEKTEAAPNRSDDACSSVLHRRKFSSATKARC